MQKLSEKLMSDEETDSDDSSVLVKRSPPWRSDKLNLLFQSLDERYESSHGSSSVSKRCRTIGPVSERPQPQGLPSWALSSGSASLVTSEPPPVSHSLSTPTTNNGYVSPAITPTNGGHESPRMITPTNRNSVWRPGENLPFHTPVRDRPQYSRNRFFHGDHNNQCTPSSSISGDSNSGGAGYLASSSVYATSDEADEEDDRGELSDWIQAVTGIRQ